MISDKASVHPKAKIGQNVTIDPFATIYEDVEIGDNTWIGPNSVIMDGARIGSNCQIFPGAVISAIPQDLKFKGERSTAVVGDGSIIRECVTINRGTADRNTTAIGKNCLLMAYVHIAHDAIIGDEVIIANQASIAGHVTIGDQVVIEGGGVAIQQFVEVGKNAFIAGASLVRKNVPPYIKVAREPLQFVGVNAIGLRRKKANADTVREIEDIYRFIFIHNANLSAGVEKVKKEFKDSEYAAEIVEFINKSPNGIVKGLG